MRKEKLIDVLNRVEPGQLIKIGTVGGSGWIYAGRAEGYWEESQTIHKTIRENNKKRREAARHHLEVVISEGIKDRPDKQVSELIVEWAERLNIATRRCALAEKTIEDFKRLEERETREVWDADGEDAINVLVTGTESGDKYSAEPYKPVSYVDMDSTATDRLITAMYSPLLTTLKNAYYNLLKDGSTTKNRSVVKKTEREISRDPYGLFSDGGKGIIKACRDAAQNRLEDEQKEAERKAKKEAEKEDNHE